MYLAFHSIALLSTVPAYSQGTNVSFGTIRQDPDAPIEVNADDLSVDQATNIATFHGNVVIGQGELRLSAQKVEVINRPENAGISMLIATGGVTLVSGTDAAEAQRADYSIDSGVIILTGDVLLTQGSTAITAQKMSINLKDGTANMSGRVKTILVTGDK